MIMMNEMEFTTSESRRQGDASANQSIIQRKMQLITKLIEGFVNVMACVVFFSFLLAICRSLVDPTSNTSLSPLKLGVKVNFNNYWWNNTSSENESPIVDSTYSSEYCDDPCINENKADNETTTFQSTGKIAEYDDY